MYVLLSGAHKGLKKKGAGEVLPNAEDRTLTVGPLRMSVSSLEPWYNEAVIQQPAALTSYEHLRVHLYYVGPLFRILGFN